MTTAEFAVDPFERPRVAWQAGMLVQSKGENFRTVQNGPLPNWGGCLMLSVIVALAAFFALRGRIRVEGRVFRPHRRTPKADKE